MERVMERRLATLVLLHVLASLAAGARGGCPPWLFLQTVDLPDTLPAALDAALSAANASLAACLDPRTQPGFAASVWYKGRELRSWGAGVADKATGRAPDPHRDLFRVASNSKLFAAMLALVFVELGYLPHLDVPVDAYVPAFAPLNPFGDGARITFRMLMSHMAGLPDQLPGQADWHNVTTETVLEALRGVPLQVAAGTLPIYSNLGFSILGHVLSEYVAPAAERGDYGALLRKYILQPLRLDADTGYDLTPDVVARLIPAYDANGASVPVEDLGWAGPCGAMYSSVRNIAAFHQATAAAYAGEPPAALALSTDRARQWCQPAFAFPDGSLTMGQPWETFTTARSGVTVLSKSGTLTGFATKSALVPALRLSVAVSFNGNFGIWYDGDALLRSVADTLAGGLVDALLALQPPRDAGPSPADYVGEYVQDADPTSSANVTLDGAGQLRLRTNDGGGDDGGSVLEAVPSVANTFRAFGNAGAAACQRTCMGDVSVGVPLQFERSADGRVVALRLVSADGSFTRRQRSGRWSRRTSHSTGGGGDADEASE